MLQKPLQMCWLFRNWSGIQPISVPLSSVSCFHYWKRYMCSRKMLWSSRAKQTYSRTSGLNTCSTKSPIKFPPNNKSASNLSYKSIYINISNISNLSHPENSIPYQSNNASNSETTNSIHISTNIPNYPTTTNLPGSRRNWKSSK